MFAINRQVKLNRKADFFYKTKLTLFQKNRSDSILVVSVAQLVARRTNNRKVVGSIPANVACITVLTGNHRG